MASSIVSLVGKQLGTLLLDEAKNLYEVSDKIEKLREELLYMKGFLEDADNREHTDKRMSMWVAEIRDLAYEAEDLIECYVKEDPDPDPHSRGKGILNTIKWYSCVCGDAVALHSIGSRIDRLRRNIKELATRLETYGIQRIGTSVLDSTYNTASHGQRKLSYSHIEVQTVGLSKHIEDLVDELVTSESAKVVGISGIGGLGKTTLARKVYSDQKVKEHFKNCVWVSISKQFQTRDVFQEILIGLSCTGKSATTDARWEIKHLTDNELPQKICKVLEKEECLVLLDDIWTKDDWDTLKPAFDSINRSCSKILITTRNLGLVRHASPSGYTHPFDVLEGEDGWKLLQQTSNMKENEKGVEKAKMEKLGKDMLKHCGGLPLAIVALGGILATKGTSHEWEVVSNKMRSYLSDTLREDGDVRVLSVLELSYDDLPFHLKPCFLYLSCFPEDFEIPADRLYHLWEAEALVTMSDGERLDDIAEAYLNQLVNRSMVQVEKRWPNGSIVSCRLHNVMRDMCLRICREVNFLKIVEGGNPKELSKCNTVYSSPTNSKLRRCVIHLKGEGEHFDDDSRFSVVDPDKPPYIRSLLVFANKRTCIDWEKVISLDLREDFSLLRALDLEGFTSKNGADMVRCGMHLRYLRLQGSLIPDRVVGYCWDCNYLETLDLRLGNGEEVKLNNVFMKLKRLRHLYLPERFVILNPGILNFAAVQMSQLETLVNFDVGQCCIGNLKKMTNLRIFSFRSGQSSIQDKNVLVYLFESPAVQNGRLKSPLSLYIGTIILRQNPTILTSFPSPKSIFITELTIVGPFDRREKGLKIFPSSLMKLLLKDWEIDKEDILELETLPYLEELELYRHETKGDIMSFTKGGFKKLLKLTLWGEGSWKPLEKWEVGEGALPNLLSLVVFNCTKLERIPEGLPSSMKLYCTPSINGSELYMQVQEIDKLYDKLNTLLKKLQDAQKESMAVTNASAMEAIKHMQKHVDEVQKIARLIKSKIEELDKDNFASRQKPGCGEGTAVDCTRSCALKKKFKDKMDEFQTLRENIHQEFREVAERRIFTVTGQHADEQTIDLLIETGDIEQIFQKAIQEQGRDQIMDTVSEIHERHDAVREVERKLLELQQALVDMAVLVDAQGDMLDNIESQVSNAVDHVQSGNTALQRAKSL